MSVRIFTSTKKNCPKCACDSAKLQEFGIWLHSRKSHKESPQLINLALTLLKLLTNADISPPSFCSWREISNEYFKLNAIISSGLLFAWIHNYSTIITELVHPIVPDVS